MNFDASMVSETWRGAIAELRSNGARYLPAFIVAASSGVAFDYIATDAPDLFALANLSYAVVMLIVQAWVIGIALEACGRPLAPPQRWRIGALFALSLISGLAFLLGLVALVLPFLYLAGRWFVAGPVMLAEGLSATDGLRRSWELLHQHWLAALILFIICLIGRFAPLAAEPFLPVTEPALLWAVRIPANMLSEGSGIVSLIASVVMYVELSGPDTRAAEIFS